MSEDVELLQRKNKALSDQLDKVTADLFTMQDTASDLKNKLEERRHSEQLAGWAIDRALETMKLTVKGTEEKGYTPGFNAQSVIDMAEKFTSWIVKSSAPPTLTKRETMQ